MIFNYFATNRALEDQLQARIHDDLISLVQDADTEGSTTAISETIDRLSQPFSRRTYFFMQDEHGKKLGGNLDGVVAQPGWQKIRVKGQNGQNTKTNYEVWGEGQTLSDGAFVFVGQDASHLLDAEHTLIISYLGSALFAGILALAAGVILSRGFLRRIDAINATSLAIMQGNLKERIPTRGTVDEIDRLSNNLNRLFDSNQALLDSLQQVTVNIAHDLRTPLSRLRNTLEQARRQRPLSKDLQHKLGLAIGESDQLLSTFSALLRIAQIESGSRKKSFGQVNLSELAEKVFGVFQAVAEDGGRSLHAEITPEVICTGDSELLLQLCVNLVENAIRHTPKGTDIILRISKPARLEVSDRGLGIPTDKRLKVLERFYRLDRSRSTTGSGLGLALVSAIATLHETKIELEDNNPGLIARVNFRPAIAQIIN